MRRLGGRARSHLWAVPTVAGVDPEAHPGSGLRILRNFKPSADGGTFGAAGLSRSAASPSSSPPPRPASRWHGGKRGIFKLRPTTPIPGTCHMTSARKLHPTSAGENMGSGSWFRLPTRRVITDPPRPHPARAVRCFLPGQARPRDRALTPHLNPYDSSHFGSKSGRLPPTSPPRPGLARVAAVNARAGRCQPPSRHRQPSRAPASGSGRGGVRAVGVGPGWRQGRRRVRVRNCPKWTVGHPDHGPGRRQAPRRPGLLGPRARTR